MSDGRGEGRAGTTGEWLRGGVGQEGAQSELQENYNDNLTLEQAENLALNTLKQVMEEKIESENVQIATVTPADGFKIHSSGYVQEVMKRIEENE